jgi:nucleoside-diphosphate-sugar epimerase
MGEAIKHILVAGGSGFVGRYLMDMLKTHGYEPYNFDIKNDPYQDAMNRDLLEKFVDKYGDFDLIINLIRFQDRKGKGGRDTGLEKPHQCIYENCTTALNLSELAREREIEKMIYVSSCGVYGVNSSELTEKTHNYPSDPYCASKIAAENIVRVYTERFGKQSKCIILRPTIIVGEKQAQQRNILQDLVDCAYNGRSLPVFQDATHKQGIHLREFVHPEDICKAILKSIDYFFIMDKIRVDSFVLGSETNRISINDLAKRIIKIVGGKSTILYCTVSEVFNQITCSAKAHEQLKWKAEIGIDAIIERIVCERRETNPDRILASSFKLNPRNDE